MVLHNTIGQAAEPNSEEVTMSALGATMLESLFALLSAACFLYVLFRLGQEKGGGHAILGFLFPVYPYVWGWANGRRLEILDIMGFWTVITLFSIAFPALMASAALSA